MNGATPDNADEKAGASNFVKGKEKEDVLPYLQNAILEQQNVESGPLPIQRLDVRSSATAASFTSTTPSPPPTKSEDVLPYMQNAILEQNNAGEKSLPIQRLDGSLSSPAPPMPSPRGPPALAAAFGTSAVSGKGAPTPPAPPVLLRHQPPPLQISAYQSAPLAPPPLPRFPASSSVAQHPPPFDHHHALLSTSASVSPPSVIPSSQLHMAEDAHHYGGHHVITDHSGGFGSHQRGVDLHHHAGPGGFDPHLAGGPAAMDVSSHAVGGHQAPPAAIGLGINPHHGASDAAGGFESHHLGDGHGGLGHGGHAMDAHSLAGGHVDLHHVAQPPLSTGHHIVDSYPPSSPPSHHAAEYNSGGGGHHQLDFAAGGLHHASTPPGFGSSTGYGGGGGGGGGGGHAYNGFGSGGGGPAFAAAAAGAQRGLQTASAAPAAVRPKRPNVEFPLGADASVVPQPSVVVLLLLLVVIPVLSLSPYWGYHGPSTVSAFMMDEFGISYLDLGLMFSLYSLPNLFMPFIAGSVLDRCGLSVASLLFNIFCLVGNILLAITYYMPEKPVSLLLISRVIFGFGGEAIIMCQQVMLARWFSGTLLLLASGFVQIFVLCLGSGGAFLFLPHFDEDGVNISLLHVLFVSFWGFVFNLFYVAFEWKWTPWLITKQLNEQQLLATTTPAVPPFDDIPLSTPATSAASQPGAALAGTSSQSHAVDWFPSSGRAGAGGGGGHLALAHADGVRAVGFDDHHQNVDNHHVPAHATHAVDGHHLLLAGGGSVSGGCMGGSHNVSAGVFDSHHVAGPSHGGHHVDRHAGPDFGHLDGHAAGGGHVDLHHAVDNNYGHNGHGGFESGHHQVFTADQHALGGQHNGPALGVGPASHHVAQPPMAVSPVNVNAGSDSSRSPATGSSLSTLSTGDVGDWGYLRIEGRAQIVTSNGREEWDNIIVEGRGRVASQGSRPYAPATTSSFPSSSTSAAAGLLDRFRNAYSTSPAASTAAATSSPGSTPILFYPRVFTSKTVGEDLQSLPLVYWLVAGMLFCVAPILPAFTAFAPLLFQERYGLGAVSSSRAAALVYCVGAGAPFAAFLLAKLRVRSFVQLLTIGGVAGFFFGFYFSDSADSGSSSFLPWFSTVGLGLLYCFVLGNGYAWVELSVPRELLGTATVLSLVITNAGMALAPFLVGLVRELSSDFDSSLIVLLGFAAAAFFFASLVFVVDIAGRGVLIGASQEPETEAERAEAERLRALKRAVREAEEAQARQREREKAEEREIDEEIRAEVEREVLRRRAERRLRQQPLPLASSTSSSSSSPSVAASSSASSSSPTRVDERRPLLSPQQRTRVKGAPM